MVIVMPGIYLALARAFTRPWMPRWVLGGWLALVAAAVVLLSVPADARSSASEPHDSPPLAAERAQCACASSVRRLGRA